MNPRTNYQSVYLKGNELIQAYVRTQRYKGNTKYLRVWNSGMIKGRDIEEDKIFDYGDIYYLKQLGPLKN